MIDFLIDFWSIFARFWRLSWGQVGTKMRKTRVPKNDQKMLKKKSHEFCKLRKESGVLAPNNPFGIFKSRGPEVQGTIKYIRDTPLRAEGTVADIYIYTHMHSCKNI